MSSKSDAEKAKSRAERFGVVSSTNLDEKKVARAERFGLSITSKKIGKIFSYTQLHICGYPPILYSG